MTEQRACSGLAVARVSGLLSQLAHLTWRYLPSRTQTCRPCSEHSQAGCQDLLVDKRWARRSISSKIRCASLSHGSHVVVTVSGGHPKMIDNQTQGLVDAAAAHLEWMELNTRMWTKLIASPAPAVSAVDADLACSRSMSGFRGRAVHPVDNSNVQLQLSPSARARAMHFFFCLSAKLIFQMLRNLFVLSFFFFFSLPLQVALIVWLAPVTQQIDDVDKSWVSLSPVLIPDLRLLLQL